MKADIVWISYHKPEIDSRGSWHEGLLEGIFDRSHWRPPNAVEFVHHDGFENLPVDASGAIVIIGAQHHANPTDYDRLNLDLARLDWCIVMLVGDEESLFDHHAIDHPAMRLWVQTPRPGKHDDIDADHFLPFGYKEDTPRILAEFGDVEKDLPWFLAGQNTHSRRRECMGALAKLNESHGPTGMLLETGGFAQGMGREAYLEFMAQAKVIPCPSGPASVDTFRVWEALEAGCIPVVDGCIPGGPDGSIDVHKFWNVWAPGPFPVEQEWADLPWLMPFLLAMDERERWKVSSDWPHLAAECSAWWQQRKRAISLQLERDVRELSGTIPGVYVDDDNPTPDDLITVVIPTSPIPSHPSTDIIRQTVDSVRAHLPDAEILILCDGVREEQADRADDYAEYLRKLCWLTEHRWHNVVPFIAAEHVHQGGLMRNYLSEVNTPLLLFVEHDTPLAPDREIPFDKMGQVILSGQSNVVRLMHEANILKPHKRLMLDSKPIDFDGLPVIRTRQWSQRPHLAKTSYYRHLIDTYFGPESRTFLEDCLYGVLDYAVRTYGEAGWDQHRVVIYAPDGDMKRSLNLDGRGDDTKYPLKFEYPGPTPEGAPRATSERVD